MPEVNRGERGLEIEFSDKEMHQIFGHSFIEGLKNAKVLYAYSHPRSGLETYTVYTKQEFAKAVHAFYYFNLRKEKGQRGSRPKINGIIPSKVYDKMMEQKWWKRIETNLGKFNEIKKEKVTLDEILSPFVVETG